MCHRRILLAALLSACVSVCAAEPGPMPWDFQALCKPPAAYPAPGFEEAGVQALFYDGLPQAGKPTRVFAWYGMPANGEAKHPAMVLVHGGGGTAFANWVRLWNDRGYAAIAMDTCGCVPRGSYGHWERHDMGGPAGWGGFDQTAQPPADQWTYHAIADVLLAHSLVRSYPEVDAERIGITGISWGGYLTCIAAGVDPRFKLAVPVYGCGFLGENSAWLDDFAKMPAETAAAWLRLWDPAVYLPRAALPMLWVTGTNDFAYPMDSLQKSYRLPTGPRTLCVRVRMPHGHGPAGEGPEEIRAFADSILKGGPPLPEITSRGRDGGHAWVTFKSQTPVAGAELTFTKQSCKWQDRAWETLPATVNAQTSTVTAELPEGVCVYFFNLFDAAGQATSSEHETLE